MTIASEICARIRKAKAWDKTAHISDYQVRVVENGAVLINLKTREAELVRADESDTIAPEDGIAE